MKKYFFLCLLAGILPTLIHATPNFESSAPNTTLQNQSAFMVSSITIKGNTLLPESTLQPLLHSHQGKESSVEGLQTLAQTLTQAYHKAGYPLATVIIPPQKIDDGVVTLQVIEGKVDKIVLDNQSRLSDTTAQGYLENIKIRQPLKQQDSERALLLLKDLAGTDTVNYRLSSGDKGTVLNVDLGQASAVDGFVQVDNYGSQSTGKIRTRAGLNLNSPLGQGERFGVQAMSSFKGVSNARLFADVPLGTQGLGVSAGLAHTRYDLGGDFKDLNATGTANSADIGVHYPIMRSNAHRLSVNATGEHRQLTDNIGATKTKTDKAINALRMGLSGSHQDGVLAGGFTQWGLDGTLGHLNIKSADAKAIDSQSAKTQGAYAKLNANIARTQFFSQNASLKIGTMGQWASKNLDSAEQLSLGGADMVSAYHSNDVSADMGVMGQAEARYAVLPSLTLGAFYEAGVAKLKHSPYTQATNTTSLRGLGLGIYGQYHSLSLQSKIAWQLDNQDDKAGKPKPKFWLKAAYQF